MAGVKTLADGRTKLAILTTAPAAATGIPTVTELTAGTDASCLVAKNGTRVSATGSDVVNDPALCSDTNSPAYGASNYEGTIAPFWLLDATDGSYTAGDNAAYEALKEKGTEAWLVFRDGPAYDDAWAAADVVDVFHVITDNPQRPTETGAYIKRNIPLGVQRAWLDVAVTAGA